MKNKVVLITGANGEIGHGLIHYLSQTPETQIIALDIKPLEPQLLSLCEQYIQCDIRDNDRVSAIFQKYELDTIYHLASILSTSAERIPETAHYINVDGTIELLKLANQQTARTNRAICFLYPSSIAVYGLPCTDTKRQSGKVREEDWCCPTTMYGCNKLYCEQLGRYYASHYQQLAEAAQEVRLDFRGLRYPGLISAFTVPSGGTSDYGPEMLHAAARGEPYHCFVRPDTRLPFMAMPDAIKALVNLAAAPAETLTRQVYNVTSFSPSALEFQRKVLHHFHEARIDFQPDIPRQSIVDTWPADIDDSAARTDWGWQPDYDFDRAFDEYLIPNIRERYTEPV
ncbi:MAG: NAD-dependent epimerase/dehydratase family protein [Anaerolineales bacterium]|nr:NAD-dependent epimerase/dehydratase family protein [Anaerolineales bacterium]